MEQVSEIKISYKNKVNPSDAAQIISSESAAKLIFNNWDQDTIELHESFKVILLNNANKVKGICTISTGGINGTVIDIRMLFALALKSLSTGIIITHNHPSGSLKPSEADKKITERILKAGELLDIKLLDHIIISPSGEYFSFSDEGLLW